MSAPLALVHDYLTQRGGAERVVLSMTRAFPDAPLYTSLYDPAATFSAFAAVEVRPLALNRIGMLRRHHRAALPLLAPAFSKLRIEADVVLCSSSGWAHGARTSGRKVVYCYTPARWLYDTARYLGNRRAIASGARAVLAPLHRWDRAAAATAQRWLTSSTAVRDRIRSIYGIDAEILPPPVTLDAAGPQRPVGGCDPGFVLCVSRLLPYKNVDAVVGAFAQLPKHRLVVAGTGPQLRSLAGAAPPNVMLIGAVEDADLRWLYANCSTVVAASYEDYGLTPLEAAAFGKPSAVLRYGGYLDTVVEGETGVFFDVPSPAAVAAAVERAASAEWNAAALRAHAATYSEDRFVARLQDVVAMVHS